MPHIKKIVMHGFKSFANKTEIIFENAMNVVVGPNGSGKSNITDALCFVLGRLSIKSIRAAKAANLLFSGNKYHKPSQECIVELIFDNEDKTFPIESPELSIKRIVRKNGQSVYKINNKIKTRQELLEILAQAGIDPNGFNIVLQGEIASLIKLSPDERRKIIEEVAGISIYETRKQKSLRELEKTDEKLNEVSAILKERNSYLRNLEKERQDALNYQKLEQTIKQCKATILNKGIQEKNKQIMIIKDQIETQKKEIEKIRSQIKKNEEEIQNIQEQIKKINKEIQTSTDNEQETLHKEIADLKAELAGLNVRKENFESRLIENKNKKIESKEKISELEQELSQIKTSSPKIKKQQEAQKEIQDKFDILEKERRRFYIIKSDLSSSENKKEQLSNSLTEIKKESQLIERTFNELFNEIKFAKSIEKAYHLKQETTEQIKTTEQEIEKLKQTQLEIEKIDAVLSEGISEKEKLKQDIIKMEVCPLCKNKITELHIKEVIENSNKRINSYQEKKDANQKTRQECESRLITLNSQLEVSKTKLNEIQIDIIKLKTADEKKEQMKKLAGQQEQTNQELSEAGKKYETLKKQFEELKNIEEQYDNARLKLQELSFTDIDIDTETSIKQRELNRLKTELKTRERDVEESSQEVKKINEKLEHAEKLIEQKEYQEQELYEKFKKLFSQKNELQDKQKAFETTIIGLQHEIRNHEEKINNYKIELARLNAELESLKFEFKEFESTEIIQSPINEIKERLQKSQFRISQLGIVNLKSLDIYDKIKEQCEQIQQKTQIIEQEKEKILKIIQEIDKKKKKSFIKTLEAVNEYFTRNFSQLSKKGEVFLDLENKQEPFEGGLNIIVKVSRGKYFDITSLSGGEKTLVALSLIFAIQEYKPYCFYIFDEIDAALDKRNSELLAALIKKYMVSGQYIIVTHNDALITEASTLYGVSMQENISKVISLKI